MYCEIFKNEPKERLKHARFLEKKYLWETATLGKYAHFNKSSSKLYNLLKYSHRHIT